ncbi:MAG: magnesium transporter [Clostridia bacterium]|nr:magnesium transporter [Clostridia bacterium]
MEEKKRNYRERILSLIRSDCSAQALRTALDDYHDYDIASVLDELTREERGRLLSAIGYEAAASIVAFLDDAAEYLSEIEPDAMADIIENMDADDALEVLEDLDEAVREEVFELMEDDEVKEEIRLLGSYSDEVFGSRMSTNYIAIERGLTVKGAMKELVSLAAENDNIHKIFVTAEDGSFYGAIDLKELIVARSTDLLEDLIYTSFPYVLDTERIDENIERVRGYSELLLPVLTADEKKLVGVITSSSIAELIDETMGDDYAKLAALGAEEEEGEGLFASLKKRIPWLVILLFLGLAVSAVVDLFENVIAQLPMIVSFQSLILGMAGNVGTQSLAVTVRSLGADTTLTLGGRVKMIGKETRVSLFNGWIIGMISFAIVAGYLLFGANDVAFSLSVAGCVGGAMCFAMMISGFTGATIPIVLQHFGVDPAVASGPLITTVNDLVAVVSYYGLAWGLLLGFAL